MMFRKNSFFQSFQFSLGVVVVALASCGKKSEGGRSLSAPAIEPPVANAIPQGMRPTSNLAALASVLKPNLTAPTCSENAGDVCSDADKIQILKQRIFLGREGCLGSAPSTIEGRMRCLLHAIDTRMVELDKQQTDKARRCPDEALQEFAFGLGNLVNFRQKFNCGQSLQGAAPEDKLYLSFGVDKDDFYLQETLSGGRSLYVKSGRSSLITEVFTFETKKISTSATSDSSSTVNGLAENNGKYAMALTHLIAKPSENSFEISVGSNHTFGKGVGCGVQARSNGTFLYTKGIFAEPQRVLNQDCAAQGAETFSPRYLEACLDANTLAPVALSSCAAITSFTVTKIRPADLLQEFYPRVTSTEHVDNITGFVVTK